MRIARRIRAASAACVVFLGAAGPLATPAARAQSEPADAALRDRVLQLVERLGDPKAEARDEAQSRLTRLGAKALSLLPEPGSVQGDERRARLEKVRESLRQASADVGTGPSLVTIQARGIRLSEALQQVQKQTGNAITDLREQLGAEVTNPAFDLDLKGVPFFEALDRIARLGDVSINASTGDGSVGITAGSPSKAPLIKYVGPFRVAFKQFTEARDLQSGTAMANAQIDVSWEPRLRPMLLTLKSEALSVKDDRGRVVKPQTMMESNELALHPETPTAELNINLEAPDRSASRLASFHASADVMIPAGIKTFRFPSLAEENAGSTQGDVKVTLVRTEVDEQVWKVNVEVAYESGGPALESYRQGLLNNRIWLVKADGSKFEHNGGFSNTGAEGGKLGFEYLFTDVPGKPSDYQLVYETPSKVVTAPLEFEFNDVPLP
ncbi:hypothetical protein OJF2_19750 [Aquisphaera giovannonii]|uniref:Uncharacterized protein n=1 Tax=Aquisphaera giovannonii TaxID=406548 RepID=A0A5B9VYQ6_9BACT|nr:hypothetical protein [Aquisphaera giovannonii]QEH33473.1 hypothetical protein OJF2_19750 [Aquisphaera giovannonii]